MKIIDEYTPRLDIPQGVVLTSIFQSTCTFYGVYGKKKCLYLFQDGKVKEFNTSHSYHKMGYMPHSQTYIMSCHNNSTAANVIYVLDCCFKEVDDIPIRSHKIENIYFDEILHLIFVVTPFSIQKYNCNGDYLGTLMNTHKKRRYQAVCTFGKFIFLAYKKDGCIYIASYNSEGAYLEQCSLGCKFAVQNMQVVIKEGYPILRLYAIKNYCYPIFVELELDGKQGIVQPCIEHENIHIECVNEDESIQTTAYIRNR